MVIALGIERKCSMSNTVSTICLDKYNLAMFFFYK